MARGREIVKPQGREEDRTIPFWIWHKLDSVDEGMGARVFDPERIDGPDSLCFHGHSPNPHNS